MNLNGKNIHLIKKINVLYIIPLKLNRPQDNPFDINFIHSLNTKDVKIFCHTLVEDKIMKAISHYLHYFELYDVVVIGNGDRDKKYSNLKPNFFHLLTKFRDNGTYRKMRMERVLTFLIKI